MIRKSQQNHKIALYIRVSTEEQASNPEGSIKSQEQRLRAQVDLKNMEQPFGEVTQVYIDSARSGKDTNRPELQRLLKAVVAKEVTLVLVTELSRLSRSIKDFAEMWELMRSHGCEFQSLREQFDTTTAAGEMVLYTIANIAQFERRQTSERISANFLARAQRGLFNGGSVPLGYMMDPERRGYLIIDETEAQIVRDLYKTFLEEGTLSQAGKKLNSKGYSIPRKKRGGGANPRIGYFTAGNMYRVLTNKAYIGVRVYQINGADHESEACWKPIIDKKTFERVQQLLKKNYRRNKRTMNARHPFLLSGLIECGVCQDRMPGKSATGKSMKIPYYAHGWSANRAAFNKAVKQSCETPTRILSRILEAHVWERVVELLTNAGRAKRIVELAHQAHQTKEKREETLHLRQRLKTVENKLEALAEHLADIPKGISPAPIFAQMKKCEVEREELRARLTEHERITDDDLMPVELSTYQEFVHRLRGYLDCADHQTKTQIIQALIQKIEVFPDNYRICYKVGKTQIVQGIRDLDKENAASESQGTQPVAAQNVKTPIFFKNRGSTTLLFVGGGGN